MYCTFTVLASHLTNLARNSHSIEYIPQHHADDLFVAHVEDNTFAIVLARLWLSCSRVALRSS